MSTASLPQHAFAIWKAGGYLRYHNFALQHVFPASTSPEYRDSRLKWLLLSDQGRQELESHIRAAGEWPTYRRIYHAADHPGAGQAERAALRDYLRTWAERVVEVSHA